MKQTNLISRTITFDRDTFFLRRVASRNEKRRGVRTSVREDRIQMRKGKREGGSRKKQRKKRKEACAIILGRASPLGHDDDNNNLNRAHLAYV